MGIFPTINDAKNRIEQEMKQPKNSLIDISMGKNGIYAFESDRFFQFKIVKADQFPVPTESPWKTDFAKFM